MSLCRLSPYVNSRKAADCVLIGCWALDFHANRRTIFSEQ